MHDYRWPEYLPFGAPIPRSRRTVPNEMAINWPQSQFAPERLPAGSPPFQPFSYAKAATAITPTYTNQNPRSPMAYSRMNPDVAAAIAAGPQSEAAQVVQAALQSIAAGGFVPFEAELIDGLPRATLVRLARLEQMITKMSAMADPTPTAAELLERLLATHDRVRARLEARLARAEKHPMRRIKARKLLRKLRERRQAKAAQVESVVPGKSREERIAYIEEQYRAGAISERQARYLLVSISLGHRPSEAIAYAESKGGLKELDADKRKRMMGLDVSAPVRVQLAIPGTSLLQPGISPASRVLGPAMPGISPASRVLGPAITRK